MRGILVVNQFLRTEKFEELYQWLVRAAKKQDIVLEIKTNAEMMPFVDGTSTSVERNADFILFWDKDIKLAKYLESIGYPVFNRASAIEICDDKALTHIALNKENIQMPKTILAPMTFENIGYTDTDFLSIVEERLGYPMVLKDSFGSFGKQVYLCHNREEVLRHLNRNTIFQEFITSSFGRDVRLQVVGDKVVTSMYRYSENGDFRANISNGGHMKPYTPTKEQEKLAVRAAKALGLHFAGVDILFGKEDEALLCEVNSNAHFKNIFDCTGVDTADFILEEIKRVLGDGM